jgi:hypothetical protein
MWNDTAVEFGIRIDSIPKNPPRRVMVDQSSVLMISSAPSNAHGPMIRNLVLKLAPSAQVRNIRGPQVSMYEKEGADSMSRASWYA